MPTRLILKYACDRSLAACENKTDHPAETVPVGKAGATGAVTREFVGGRVFDPKAIYRAYHAGWIWEARAPSRWR
jgi:hypothetical protein